jgi:hypothetical protein
VTVKIKTLGVEVPGRVVRNFENDTTTLLFNEEQVRLLHEELGTVVRFFDAQTVPF